MSITPRERTLVHKLASGKGNAYDWLELKHSLSRTGVKVREHDKRKEN